MSRWMIAVAAPVLMVGKCNRRNAPYNQNQDGGQQYGLHDGSYNPLIIVGFPSSVGFKGNVNKGIIFAAQWSAVKYWSRRCLSERSIKQALTFVSSEATTALMHGGWQSVGVNGRGTTSMLGPLSRSTPLYFVSTSQLIRIVKTASPLSVPNGDAVYPRLSRFCCCCC